MWQSNCLYSLRKSNCSGNLQSSTSLYQTISKSNTQLVNWAAQTHLFFCSSSAVSLDGLARTSLFILSGSACIEVKEWCPISGSSTSRSSSELVPFAGKKIIKKGCHRTLIITCVNFFWVVLVLQQFYQYMLGSTSEKRWKKRKKNLLHNWLYY